MYITIQVKTGSKRNSIHPGKNADEFKVETREKPLENRANIKVCELVAEYFGQEYNKVRIVRGHHRPRKIVEISPTE